MAKKKEAGYLSGKEIRAISKANRKITGEMEKKWKRKNVPEEEYLTTMRDPANAVEFDDLHTYFFTDAGTVKSVDGVSFDVPIGKTVGVVGESGCGKSVTSLSLMQLLQRPQGQIVSGHIRLNLGSKAYDISQITQERMQKLRGNAVSMIFQEPMTSLNPVFRIGDQVDEVIELHDGEGMSKEEIKARTIKALEMVQILDLLRDLKDKINSSIMLITHDLGVIAEMADYVVVMYAGRVIEKGTAEDIFYHPAHPYTIGLMASKPVVGREVDELYSIPGKVPNPINMPDYCYFRDRCEMRLPCCDGEYPCEISLSDTHKVSCYRAYEAYRDLVEQSAKNPLLAQMQATAGGLNEGGSGSAQAGGLKAGGNADGRKGGEI